jgi:pilus assembly protein CpaB
MNARSIITLVVAVLFGLGAMMLTRRLLNPGTAKKEEETQEVLVAARDFKEEERLKPEMVSVVRMVKSAVPAGAFSSFKDVEERWVRTTMLEGDVLIEKKLGPKGTPPGLVANIPKGMRAFAIDVTEQSGVSGFILPGHRVDVVRFESSDKKDVKGETILQNVLVLAAGQLFTRPDEKSVQSRTVTLALTPDDVDILAAARAKGTLSLSLRGVNDHDVVARPKPKADPEVAYKEKMEKFEREQRQRIAEEQQRRIKLEQELQDLKQALAKKVAEPPPTKPAPAPPVLKVATIYRGINNPQRVLLDRPAVSELTADLDSDSEASDSSRPAAPAPRGRPNVASRGDTEL